MPTRGLMGGFRQDFDVCCAKIAVLSVNQGPMVGDGRAQDVRAGRP